MAEGAQIEVEKEAPTRVEDPNDPQGPPKEPTVKRQHLIVMRHGERIDEVICTPYPVLFKASIVISTACGSRLPR